MRRLTLILVIMVVLVGIAPTDAQDNVAERNKDAVREALAQLSAGSVDGFFKLYADHFQANQGDATLYDTTTEDWVPVYERSRRCDPRASGHTCGAHCPG